MVADAFSRPVGIPVVASPGSCSGSSVSPVFWSFLEPQAQGLVSSVHSPNVSPTLAQLINYSNLAQLQKHCSETQDLSKLAGSGWLHHLTLVLLGLRSAPKDDQACFSAEDVYGSPLILPGMFLDPPKFLSEIFKS